MNKPIYSIDLAKKLRAELIRKMVLECREFTAKQTKEPKQGA